jgi:hypothetical protein
MLDYQRIVEEIQAAIQSAATLDWDLLRDCAAEYALACDEVNERLGRCGRLLRQGLRSEAIQLADQEPNLLDAAAILDFPELPEWQALLAANSMILPPDIRVDVASELNVAYAAEAPLQSLLKHHRLLALARAPLAPRIQVLRSIRQADSANPIWAEDLRLLENARHREIQSEIASAAKRRELPAVERLCGELSDPGWLHPPRQDFVTTCQDAKHRLAAELAAEQLVLIEKELASAYAAFDVAAGRAARTRWNETVVISRLGESDAIVRQAAPALAWLAQQDDRENRDQAFAAALASLERGLEEDTPRLTLERLLAAAQRFEEEIPVPLVRRYQERIRLFEVSGRRRFLLIAGGVLSVLALLGGTTAWVLRRGQERAQIQAAAQGLARLIDQTQWAQSQTFYDNLAAREPKIAQAPAVQGELARLRAQIAAENERKSTFAMLMKQVRDSGLDRPDRVALAEALKVARSAAEKGEIASLEAEFARHDRDKQRERDTRFEDEFRMLLAAVEAAESGLLDVSALDGSKLTELLANIDALSQRSGGVSQALSSQLQPLRVRVQSLRKNVAQLVEQQQALGQLSAGIGKPDVYEKALRDFVEQFPDVPISGEFQRVLEEAQHWKDLKRWGDLLADPRFGSLAKISPDDARRLLEAGDKLLAEAGHLPLADFYRQKQPYLQGVAARIDALGKSRLSGLKTLFDDVLVAELWMVETIMKERYYSTKDPAIAFASGKDSVLIEHIINFQGEPRRKSFKRAEVSLTIKAPQARLTTLARPLLKIAENGDWEKGMYGLIKGVADQTDVDHLLQLILLRRAIDTARQGSHSLRQALEPTWERLESADVDLSANWLLPNDAAADNARVKARSILGGVVDLPEQGARAAEILRSDTAPLPPLPVWIGWLRPAEGKDWKCITSGAHREPGDLYVLISRPTDGESATAWEKIGTWSAEGAVWEDAAKDSLLTGRPVYFVPTIAGAGAPAASP